MGGLKTFWNEEKKKFEKEEYMKIFDFHIEGLKISVIEKKYEKDKPNTPMQSHTSDIYICLDKKSRSPKQISFYKNYMEDKKKKKFVDYDLEIHHHEEGYVGKPHKHYYDYELVDKPKKFRSKGDQLTAEELENISKILLRFEKEKTW